MNKLDQYIERYARLHERKDGYLNPDNEVVKKDSMLFDGKQFYRKFRKDLQNIIAKKHISMLDYGCGKAEYMFRPWEEGKPGGLVDWSRGRITAYWLFDPAVKEYSTKPPAGAQFDVVACADVMEHVPEEFVDQVLDEIAGFTKPDGIMLFSISENEAFKRFPDGENLHCTRYPLEWWMEKLLARNRSFVMYHSNDARKNKPQVQKRVHQLPNCFLTNLER